METKMHKIRSWLHKHDGWRLTLAIVLVALAALELHALVANVKETRQADEQYLSYQRGRIIRTSDTITAADIQPWMTFSYINFVFKLPPGYLQSALAITDSRYPNIQIARYVRLQRLSLEQFLLEVRQAVGQHPS